MAILSTVFFGGRVASGDEEEARWSEKFIKSIQSMSTHIAMEEIRIGMRFLRDLPSFLRQPITPAEAAATVRHRLENRAADFLALAKEAIYDNPESPYLRLLRSAGCEYGDLANLLKREGVEGTLHILLNHGVYLTADEFKGRQSILRGSETLDVHPTQFRNPTSVPNLWRESGGSRGTRTLLPVDLSYVREVAVNYSLCLAARGGTAWKHGIWLVPGSTLILRTLDFAIMGSADLYSFSLLNPGVESLHPRYVWSERLMRWVGRLARTRLPYPLHVPISDPLPIVNWMSKALARGEIPHLHTFASSAVRLCLASRAAGIDLTGAQFTVASETLTEARLAVIRRSGAIAVGRYGNSENGFNAYGCLAPEGADDLHLFSDRLGLIQPGGGCAHIGLHPNALLFTSLRPTTSYVLINYVSGDQATVMNRQCGCPLERLGWETHLHSIRSDEKLSTAGMNFADTEVIRILEDVLPARFGGAVTDYQLVEEDDNGNPRLKLFVNPSIGPLDPDLVRETFYDSLSEGAGAEQVMGRLWRDAQLLDVERKPPLVTPSGKILHLHVAEQKK